MEMEFMAEFTEGMSRDRARQIIKGKRTKRQRPCSPFAVSATSGNSDDGDCSIDASEISTKEDEDMANCLIMLAQSVEEKTNSDQIRRKTERLSGRRFSEMSSVTAAGGKSGFYVYECKTCNRTFPSFQALGGHRASHKKPKVNVEEKKSSSGNVQPPLTEYAEEDHDQNKVVVEDDENKVSIIVTDNVQKSPSPSSGHVQITGLIINNNTKGKVHECSICGSEFLSGQALGGHMRKHRPIPATVTTVNRTGISINTDDINITDDQIIEKSPAGCGSMLSLDLNFPPPEFVEDHHQSKFQFTASSSQQHLVFSSPAFVDCHY